MSGRIVQPADTLLVAPRIDSELAAVLYVDEVVDGQGKYLQYVMGELTAEEKFVRLDRIGSVSALSRVEYDETGRLINASGSPGAPQAGRG